MRIVLATPLYPPDIEEPAPYVKELAARLRQEHQVVILTYGRLPEKIEGVAIQAIDKRQPLPLRLMHFTVALIKIARESDILYVQNGPSVEAPLAVLRFFSRIPVVMHIGDAPAHKRASETALLHFVEAQAFARAKAVIEETPLPKPEKMPLEAFPHQAFEAYESSWKAHLRMLNNIFAHA